MRTKKKTKDPAISRGHSYNHLVSGDQVVTVETTVVARAREVDWEDVLAAVEVEPDELAEAPWKDCDGYEHQLIAPPDEGYNEDHLVSSRDYGGRNLIYIDPADSKHWGSAYPGAAKQVVAEAKAEELQRTYEQLAAWYRNGWESWYVSCRYMGAESGGLGGIDSLDYAEGECAEEQAREVCDRLRKRGHVIVGEPDWEEGYRQNRRDGMLSRIARAMGFSGKHAVRDYKAWLADRRPGRRVIG